MGSQGQVVSPFEDRPNQIETDDHNSNPSSTAMVKTKKTDKNRVDIMSFDSERTVLTSLFAMRVLISGWNRWSTGKTALVAGDTLKRISQWYNVTLKEMTRVMTSDHNPPKFARYVLRLKRADCYSKNPSGVHICLLTSASMHLLDKCSMGLGPLTHNKMLRWGELLRLTRDSSLFMDAPSMAKTEFITTYDDLEKLNQQNSSYFKDHPDLNSEEHPFLNVESLFIQIAHMVWFYSKTHGYDSLPHYHPFWTFDRVKMRRWENYSGELFTNVFELTNHGLDATFDGVMEPTTIANIQLPYDSLKFEITAQLPSLSDLHKEIIQSLVGETNKISEEYDNSRHLWYSESRRAIKYFNQAVELNEQVTDRSYDAEKYRRHYRKKHPGSRVKHPTEFQRDAFLMGANSYHKGLPYREPRRTRMRSRPTFIIGRTHVAYV